MQGSPPSRLPYGSFRLSATGFARLAQTRYALTDVRQIPAPELKARSDLIGWSVFSVAMTWNMFSIVRAVSHPWIMSTVSAGMSRHCAFDCRGSPAKERQAPMASRSPPSCRSWPPT